MKKTNYESGFAALAVVAISLVVMVGIGLGVWLTSKPKMAQVTPTPTPLAPTRTSDSSSAMISMTAQNSSGLNAKYQLVALGSPSGISTKTKVVIKVSNAPQGVSMPAHIHSGTCANLGPVKYPLANVVNGSSATDVTASILQLKLELPLAINIHKSVAEAGVYVACANLNADGSLDLLYNAK